MVSYHNGIIIMYPDGIRLHTRVNIIEKLFIKRFKDKFPKYVILKML